MTSSIALPTGTFRNNDPRSSGRRLVNCMSEISPQTSDLDLKSKVPPVYLRRMFGISPYASAVNVNPALLLHMDGVVPTIPASFLGHFDGANGQTTAIDSSQFANPITFLGNAALSTTTPLFGTASLGSATGSGGNGVSVPITAGSALDISTGDFTIEFWFFILTTFQGSFLSFEVPSNASILLTMNPSGVVACAVGGSNVNNSTHVSLGVWNSAALTRSGNNYQLFVNGVGGGNVSIAGPLPFVPQTMYIHSSPLVGTSIDGRIDEVRITKGAALYTANYTPSTIPLTAQIPFGTPPIFVDSSLNNATMTASGGAAITDIDPKFGDGDGSFPSVTSDSILSTPVTANGPLDIFGPTTGGDFTIQGWFMAPAFVEPFVIVDYGDSSGGSNHNGIVIGVSSGGTAIIVTPTVTGWTAFSNGGTTAINAGQWNFFALVRKGSKATLFLNGFALPNGATNWASSALSPGQITFGASATLPGAASQPFFLDEVAVYPAALYTTTFTPPITPTPSPSSAVPTLQPVRGIWEMASVTYVVIGDSLYSMTNDGTFTFPSAEASLNLVATGIAGQGFVRMTDNTKCLFILVPNTNIGYTYTVANGFAQELDETFTFFGAKDVWFIDSFMVFLAMNGLEFYNDDGAAVSGTGPITFTTGGVFPREFGTDPFVGMCVDHRTVHMFGTRTTEGYVDAGNATESPFAAAPDAFMQIGCHPNCGYTVALQDQAVMWVANDLTVRRLNGQTPIRISNSGVEAFLEANKDKLAGSYAFSPNVGGHPLYAVTFPLASKTLAYDCLTTEWFDLESLFASLGYWRPLCYFNSQGLQLVGDSQSSVVGFLDANTFTEFGSPQAATFYTQSVYDNHNRIRHNRVELVVTAGGSTSITTSARVTMLLSDDSGATFRNGQVKNIGTQGQRTARAIWFALGMSRDRAYGFQISDPTPTFTVQVTADLAGGQW